MHGLTLRGDTRAVLTRVLGMTDRSIRSLEEQGAVASALNAKL
jgi:hypothetical protein